MENRDKSTPLGNRVASANRIAADIQPKITAETFSNCFRRTHRQINSGKEYQPLLQKWRNQIQADII